MIQLRYPQLTKPDFGGKPGGYQLPAPVDPIVSYLHQLVSDLNIALSDLDARTGNSGREVRSVPSGGAGGQTDGGKDSEATFNELKALIIKSADIVNAYYEIISTRLAGSYVAKSEFGTFSEETEQMLEATSTAVEQMFTHIQEIITDVEAVEHTLIETTAHIKSGLLYHDEGGVPVYGLEIGQRNEVDGEEVFNKYARFTADKLSFYDANDNEVAYVSDRRLYILHVHVTGSFTLGNFVDTVLADGSVVTRWVENGGGA